MEKKRVKLEMSEAEAWALLRLAECAGNTYEDALAILVSPAKVRAGERAIDKLTSAWVATQ